MSSTTREKEVINLIIRQTDYTEEEASLKLKQWNNNYINVIKEYLNPDFNEKPKETKTKTLNQQMMGEIRNFMDDVYIKYENRKRYNQYVNILRNRAAAEQNKQTSTSNEATSPNTETPPNTETSPQLKIEEVE
jgi:hypothetical protein